MSMNYADFDALVKEARSIRRFDSSVRVTSAQLTDLIATVANTPNAVNTQVLRFIPVNEPETCAKVFSTVKWAGLMKEWAGPTEAEIPTGYIIIAADPAVADKHGIDVGIAAQTLQMGARAMGLGCCMLGSYKSGVPEELLGIKDLKIALILAFGVPAEQVVIDEMPVGGNTAYWRAADNIHHVPKRCLEELIPVSFMKD